MAKSSGFPHDALLVGKLTILPLQAREDDYSPECNELQTEREAKYPSQHNSIVEIRFAEINTKRNSVNVINLFNKLRPHSGH